MNMMVAGLNGVPLESVAGPPEVVAKKQGRDIAIHHGHLKKAYHVLEPIQRQIIATKNPALVGAFWYDENKQKYSEYYVSNVWSILNSFIFIFQFCAIAQRQGMALDMIIIKWYVPMVQLRIVRRTKNATQLNHFPGISHMTAMGDAVRQVSLNI